MTGISHHRGFALLGPLFRSRARRFTGLYFTALATAGLIIPTSAAHAATDSLSAFADLGLEGLGEVVSDEELGEMRGRFIRPGEISFFGISMLTSWSDESGVTTTANLMFNVDFLASGEGGAPSVQLVVSWNREGDPAMDVLDTHEGYTPFLIADPAVPLGGLETGAGAAQANFIAGADNHARNGLQVALVPSSAINPGSLVDGADQISETTTVSFIDGDTVQFQVADNHIGLVMTGNDGIDSSLQTVGGDIGRVLQQTMLNSNSNDVFNSTSIVFGTDALPGRAAGVSVAEAMNSMNLPGF